MGISRIRISNYRSIKKLDFSFSEANVQCLLGKNGVGKTTIMDAIDYFYQIAESDYNRKKVIDINNPYSQKTVIELIIDFKNIKHKDYRNNISKYLMPVSKWIQNEKILIRMTQTKNGNISWYPFSRKDVLRILKLFPLYRISTRFINLRNWSEIWDVISELSISLVNSNPEKYQKTLLKAFTEIYGSKFSKAYETVSSVFDEESISLNTSEYYHRFKSAIVTCLGGSSFLSDDYDTSYYSDGINSLKYITLYINLITKLCPLTQKEPIVMLDEPEIGLHPQYIEDFALTLNKCHEKKVLFIVSTHSAHLLSCIIKNNIHIAIYEVYLKNRYTKIRQLFQNTNDFDNYLANDNTMLNFFSNAIVAVEGQTEIQLFCNPEIQKLYPEIKKVTIYPTGSNDATTKILNSSSIKKCIPYLCIIDMDKVLYFSNKYKRFSLKTDAPEINPFSEKNTNKIIYRYYSKKKHNNEYHSALNELIDINKELKRSSFDHSSFWIYDYKYEQIIKMIQKYAFKESVIVMRSTIEGAMINDSNWTIFLDWLIKEEFSSTSKKSIRDMLQKLLITPPIYSDHGNAVVLRLIKSGKTDYIENPSNTNVPLDIKKQILDKLSDDDKGKTSNWIGRFLSFYFKNYNSSDDINNRKNTFEQHFPELSFVLQKIESLVKY
ncbi:MAG: retron Eco8 family effector endonuclease [Butyrivibrio sp.]|jgi:predicted ATP-dependent endonuclease of OLD family|nr:retron Eco8 family effector endonuclease [Butyrivibrio sp.]